MESFIRGVPMIMVSLDILIQDYAALIKGLSGIKSVAVGWHHSVALNNSGHVFVWGSDPSKATNDTLNYFRTIEKLKTIPPIKKIACGSWHSLALDSFGNVWGWGWNKYGMLGTNDTLSNKYPRQLKDLKNICTIADGYFQSLVVDDKGVIWTMGDNALVNWDKEIIKYNMFHKKSGLQIKNPVSNKS